MKRTILMFFILGFTSAFGQEVQGSKVTGPFFRLVSFPTVVPLNGDDLDLVDLRMAGGLEYNFRIGSFDLPIGLFVIPTVQVKNGEASNYRFSYGIATKLWKIRAGLFHEFLVQGKGLQGYNENTLKLAFGFGLLKKK